MSMSQSSADRDAVLANWALQLEAMEGIRHGEFVCRRVIERSAIVEVDGDGDRLCASSRVTTW